MKPAPKRCAVYTRKSSDEGLDQEFNSLDAQREAGEAYVKSQSSEGWHLLGARYDDGGYSGGSMERPALKRLLVDIEAGLVDVVVVYKIDRLTRSLADFARIVELFDRHGVSFVSVTQSFNTTSSMGRLTLNVLLSFAQFEREVTGERIRDKIAASKAKGMWMGGIPPMGYASPTDSSRTLVVDEPQAEIIRSIFARYLELGSVHALQAWLDENGIRSRQWTTSNGKVRGGQAFSRGALFHLLRNRTYVGMIVHKGKAHPGNHPPIVDLALFDAVQEMLDQNGSGRRSKGEPGGRAPLAGRIFDAAGHPMSPSFSRGKSGRTYRYYVSAPLQQGAKAHGDHPSRLSAPLLEKALGDIGVRLLPDHKGAPLAFLTRIEVYASSLQLLMPIRLLSRVRERVASDEDVQRDHDDPKLLRLTVPLRMPLRGGRSWLVGRTMTPGRRDPTLIKGLRSAHEMIRMDRQGLPHLEAGPGSPYRRRLVRLAFLAPDIQEAILAGRQAPDLLLQHLLSGPIPLLWSEQRRLFGSGA